VGKLRTAVATLKLEGIVGGEDERNQSLLSHSLSEDEGEEESPGEALAMESKY
jgi:hypothetical protein